MCNPTLKERRRLLQGYHEVIREIQALPEFENFMKAQPFHTLQKVASEGPIIIINHCHWCWDIVIILHDLPPTLVPKLVGMAVTWTN